MVCTGPNTSNTTHKSVPKQTENESKLWFLGLFIFLSAEIVDHSHEKWLKMLSTCRLLSRQSGGGKKCSFSQQNAGEKMLAQSRKAYVDYANARQFVSELVDRKKIKQSTSKNIKSSKLGILYECNSCRTCSLFARAHVWIYQWRICLLFVTEVGHWVSMKVFSGLVFTGPQ